MNFCTSESSFAVSPNALVFSGGELWDEDELDARTNTILQSVPGPSSATANETSQSDEEQRASTYVRVFEDMICTIIKEERHLLNDEEIAILTVFAHLSYDARYLMVKLLLRKQETWHRLDSLKYEGELGSTSAIVNAIDELCRIGPESSDVVTKGEFKEQAVVDLAMVECIANVQQEQAKPGPADVGAPEALSENRPLALARCEREMDLKSLLECLRVDELKAVAKQLKLKHNQNKNDLINDLLGASSSQTTLTSFVHRMDATPSKGGSSHQTKLSLGKLKSQQGRLRDIVLRHIVKCVRVDEEFFGVIHRVNLVYFRLNQYTPGIDVTALLTRFGKRAYPGYKHARTRNIWPSRQALLDYEEVLILDGEIDELLAGNVPLLGGRITWSKTPVRFLSTCASGNTTSTKKEDLGRDEDVKLDVKLDSARARGARMVKDIFERVYPRWQDLVKLKGEEEGRMNGLERFHHGHVLTRIVCKGCAALGILGDHVRELEVLEALLAQRKWRRGQRGRWHERRALILSTYFPKDEETAERTLNAVIDGLEDSDTHLVFRPKLQRRLRKLENKLKIPIKDRHKCDAIIANAGEVVFEAVRLRHRAASLKLDRTGRCVDSNVTQQDIKQYVSPLATSVKPEHGSSVGSTSHHKSLLDVRKGKSIWLGRNSEELTVEDLALQRYAEQGFKGVHCETRVITMLFTLLFWDIIFESIPGAFETPYQTAPLDIAEDSFYHARKERMEERLTDIEAGKGINFLQAADAENRASSTWCVGVQWDLFSSEDLVDIVTCIGGKALSVICRVLCENYASGSSGGPDLFLWNIESGACKFVEVKGPGDSLQENQRVWIDILLKAPVAVEICRVVEEGDETDKKPNVKTPKSSRKRTKQTPRKEEGTLVDDDADALPYTFDDSHVSVENQAASTGSRSSLGPVNLHAGTSSALAIPPFNPSKRKGSPLNVAPPTPSKQPRTS